MVLLKLYKATRYQSVEGKLEIRLFQVGAIYYMVKLLLTPILYGGLYYNLATKKSRGFGFITWADAAAYKQCLATATGKGHVLLGKLCAGP